MYSLNYNNGLGFLSNYHNDVEKIRCEIVHKINSFIKSFEPKRGVGKLCFIQYKDLQNWDGSTLSTVVKDFAKKIIYMVQNKQEHNILPMVNRILYGSKKKFWIPNKYSCTIKSQSLGIGDFRIGEQVFTFTYEDIIIVKQLIEKCL